MIRVTRGELQLILRDVDRVQYRLSRALSMTVDDRRQAATHAKAAADKLAAILGTPERTPPEASR